jgi:very-short-patch-repair endonuclease
MRKQMSPPEVMLWMQLRGRRPGKPKFRRQHPFGHVILDFYCPAARLAIEVDGATHWSEEAHARDEARTRWLKSQGVSVHRVPAGWIFNDSMAVAEDIIERAMALISAEARRERFAPSTIGSSLRSANGPPPTAPRGR